MREDAGKVYLVGAGPGDEGLITEKGKRSITAADVIVYDRLVNARLLEHAKDTCEFVYCGKLPKHHVMRQEQINQVLVRYAQEGKTVVRLKGGDPSVFGRVGEEAAELAVRGIPYEMVPGVTSSIAAAAYAGIPVTHREYSNTFTMATGHCKEDSTDLDFAALAKSKTAAFYMGIQNLSYLSSQLIANGRDRQTPVAVIEWGTTGRQKTVLGTLASIQQRVTEAGIANPAMTVIGEVAQLRRELAWFEEKPFYGKRVLVAKAAAERSDIAAYLAENGADVWEIPHFRKRALKLAETEVRRVLEADRVVFYAPDSVAFFMEAILVCGLDVRDLPRRMEGVSAKSVEVLGQYGIRAGLVQPADGETLYIGRALSLAEEEKLQAAWGRGVFLATHQLEHDARFDEVSERMWTEFPWETVMFPNQAAVAAFVAEMERMGVDKAIYTALSYACIGKTTEDLARAYGFTRRDELQTMLQKQEWKKSCAPAAAPLR
ncbi:uroporphyrinogen-III C-methyltransferase [Ectobacillus ponti]|uniref:Uroporphyrinogen-III C-methyltransferase n=1 Tax=Ectobacillus ponti TaxID=2961894 RepID=A0AA41X925_9BACI|nr:uroporphyrinogen-III C-methyltransferase [Ectobacillus ponti]MCP8968543.1 uroporphyrinogen-III C-methyltransferase [Ectobacillus ponti]